MACLIGDGTITLQKSGGGGVEDSRYGRLPMTRAGRAGTRDSTRLLSVCVLVVLAGAVSVPGLGPGFVAAADGASLPPGFSTTITLPPNAATELPPEPRSSPTFGRLSAVACSPIDSCVAVGSYPDISGGQDLMAVTESGGVWEPATQITLPPGAYSYDDDLESVACPATGSCVAIGSYSDSSGSSSMAVEESGGVWGPVVPIPGIELHSVACSAPGWCVALGNGSALSMVVAESDGVWGKPEALSLPANAASNYVDEVSLACQAIGQCFLAGDYTDTSHHDQMMGLSELNGKWGPAREIMPPAGVEGEAHLYSVACPASGSCVAVGIDSRLSIDASESNGEWVAQASSIAPLQNTLLTDLFQVACPGAGLCIAVGYDEPGLHGTNPIAVSGSAGTWSPASEIAPPSHASTNPSGLLRWVACSATESCLAIGLYEDSSGQTQAMAVSESNGVWEQASEITAPPSASNSQTDYEASLNLLACPGLGPCTALGTYSSNSGTHLMAAGATASPYGSESPAGSITVTAPPIVTNFTQSHRRWREGNRLSRISRKSRLPLGTVFSLTLDEPAKVSFTFTQLTIGRHVKGKCVAQSRKNHRKRPCKRAVTRGTLSFTGHAGPNKLSFQGRISRRQKLKPGRYTLMLTAAGTSGQSAPKTLSFTIVK
jgi:hypothetical protein